MTEENSSAVGAEEAGAPAPVQTNSSTQIRIGVALSFTWLLLSNLAAIFITPYMLRMLGKAEFGLYNLIGAVVGYLAVLDFGLNNSIVRYVAKYRAERDRRGEENFLAMALMTYAGIAVLCVIVGLVLYWNLDALFGSALSAQEMGEARTMFLILVFNITLSFPNGAFIAMLNGYELFSYTKSVDIAKVLLRTGLLVLVLSMGFKAVAIVMIDTAVTVVFFLMNMLVAFFRVRIRIVVHAIDRSLMSDVFVYSFWMFIALVFSQLYPRIGQFLLGMKTGTSAVALFAIAVLLNSYYGTFANVLSNMLLPHATKIVVNGASGRELTDMMIKVGRLQFLLVTYILGGFILFGQAFVLLWVGDGFKDVWLIGLLMMVPSTLAHIRDVGGSIQQAQNRTMFRAFYTFSLAVNTAVFDLIALQFVDGPLAMGIGFSVAMSLGNVMMSLYYNKVIKLEMRRFHIEVFRGTLPSLLVAVVVFEVVTHLLPVLSWSSLIGEGLLYSATFALLVWRFGMNEYEHATFRHLADSVIGNARRLLRMA
jgi:O-antigen/teichoic acid export membrane protein